MIARFSGGVLGLLAFGIATMAGLAVGNPPEVILSRSLWALVIFCVIGMVVGAAVQAVVNEYIARQTKTIFPPDNNAPDSAQEDKSTSGGAEPMGTE